MARSRASAWVLALSSSAPNTGKCKDEVYGVLANTPVCVRAHLFTQDSEQEEGHGRMTG